NKDVSKRSCLLVISITIDPKLPLSFISDKIWDNTRSLPTRVSDNHPNKRIQFIKKKQHHEITTYLFMDISLIAFSDSETH
ncbi:MAG: hypothetical protein M3Z01_09150, partial [Thermoproteota archaeon]|nr:hypothetical protein [Thermoproteota archaeon]